jgi:PD-(D/E)XK nuclease superfamily
MQPLMSSQPPDRSNSAESASLADSSGCGSASISTAASTATISSLSQSSLTLLSVCPRKFQYAVLEQLSLPNPSDQQERQDQGSRFHLLVQQWLMNLPIAPLIQANAELGQWLAAFERAAPDILAIMPPDPNSTQSEFSQQYSEFSQQFSQQYIESDRTLYLAGYLLTVRYDLLLTSPDQAKILDWKTYAKPESDRWLAQNWQTRLYLFLLVETSRYMPEQVSLIYWFFQSSPDASQELKPPQSLRFTYSRTQHEQTRQDLTQLLAQLTQWLGQYSQGTPFPQHGVAHEHCPMCSFSTRCFNPGRSAPDGSAQATSWAIPDWAEIQEIPL